MDSHEERDRVSIVTRFSVEVQDEYVTQSGFRENRSGIGQSGGPTWSVVKAGPVRAGELTHAAGLAIEQLGALNQYIDLVELSFSKPALVSELWPTYVVHVKPPNTTLVFKVYGEASSFGAQSMVRTDGPFPTDRFVEHMVKDIRLKLHRLIGEHQSNLQKVVESLVPTGDNAASDVA